MYTRSSIKLKIKNGKVKSLVNTMPWPTRRDRHAEIRNDNGKESWTGWGPEDLTRSSPTPSQHMEEPTQSTTGRSTMATPSRLEDNDEMNEPQREAIRKLNWTSVKPRLTKMSTREILDELTENSHVRELVLKNQWGPKMRLNVHGIDRAEQQNYVEKIAVVHEV